MIISTNREPSLDEFEKLCNNACLLMNKRAKQDPDYYLSKGRQKLEKEVKEELDHAAKGTVFEGSIEIISGQRFPDIVAAKYFGVEVKSTKEDKWTLIGGSVAEGTRVEDVKHIFLLFGKLHKPVEFKTLRYEECLCDIAVTHSPRYKIDMNLPDGKTIFHKMGITYDELQKKQNPIQHVVEYFRSTLKPGESLWWVNGEEATTGSAPAKIRMWKTLSKEERNELIAQGFALFPELFGDSKDKYERFTLWLVANHGVVSSSMRDPFSAGGQSDLDFHGIHYERLPQKYHQLFLYRYQVKDTIMNIEDDILCTTWGNGNKNLTNRLTQWRNLVTGFAKKEKFDVSGFLENIFSEE